jgi:outer membrane protein
MNISLSIRRFLLLVVGMVSGVQGATLTEAVDAAMQYDSEFSAAQNARNAEREKYNQGLSGLLPSITFDGGYSKQDQPSATYAAQVNKHNYSINLTQPLFDISKYAGFKQGELLAELANIEYHAAQQKLINDVSDAFFNVLFQREVLLSAETATQAFSKQLAQVKAGFKLGENTRTDIDEAQANYDQAVAKEIASHNDLDMANGVYHRLTGLQADEIIPLNKNECWTSSPDMSLPQAQIRSATGNFQIRSSMLKLAQAKNEVVAAHGAHLPVVSLQAGYGSNWSRGANDNELDSLFGTTAKSRSTMVGVNVSVPIFSGGRQLSQSREAVLKREQAKDLLRDAQRKADQDTRSSYLGITNGIALLRAQKRAVVSAENKLKSIRYGREVGLRTVVDELNALQGFYESLRNYSEARYKYLMARLNFLAILGELDYSRLNDFQCRK